jgi:hypothetical protein
MTELSRKQISDLVEGWPLLEDVSQMALATALILTVRGDTFAERVRILAPAMGSLWMVASTKALESEMLTKEEIDVWISGQPSLKKQIEAASEKLKAALNRKMKKHKCQDLVDTLVRLSKRRAVEEAGHSWDTHCLAYVARWEVIKR